MSNVVAVKVTWRGVPAFPERYASAVEKVARDIAAHWQQNIRDVGAVDTGAYLNSVEAERLTDQTWVVHDGVEHGVYVELGTHHMPARPCAQPAIATVKQTLGPTFSGIFA